MNNNGNNLPPMAGSDRDENIVVIRGGLVNQTLETLRRLEVEGAGFEQTADVVLVLEAVNIEIAARVAAELRERRAA